MNSSVCGCFSPAVRSSHFPFPVTETICVMRSQRRFSGQISSNVSTEHPLIWLIFQTFDEGEKDSRRML